MHIQELERRRYPLDDKKLYFTQESSIDFLAINASCEVIANEDRLSHDRLLAELSRLDSMNLPAPALQVLFVNTEPEEKGGDCALSLATANFLCDCFRVPRAYIADAASRAYGHPEIHHGRTHDPSGGISKEEGWYSCYISQKTAMSFVWFSYGQGTATYVITRCDKSGFNNGVRQNVAELIEGRHMDALLQPLAIDLIIAEVTIHLRREDLRSARQRLNRSVLSPEALGEEDPGENVSSQVRQLHRLSYTFINYGVHTEETEEILTFLLGVHKALCPIASIIGGSDDSSVTYSLSTLLSETSGSKRRIQGEIDRTQSVINHYHHLASDAIVQATRRTALETQKDNTAMITMAALTMLFLPGTFVSGIFSMDFLGPLPGVETSPPGSRWWLYPATTVPLTTLVFVIWKLWMSYRVRRNIGIGRPSEQGSMYSSEQGSMYGSEQGRMYGLEQGDIPEKARNSAWSILPRWLTTVRPRPGARTKNDIETGEHPNPHPRHASQTKESH